jgi:hypothetical protein
MCPNDCYLCVRSIHWQLALRHRPRLPPSGNGDRESGRFSQLPADRCALEVRSTTSSTYEFLFAHSPLCCGSKSSARPSFLRETQKEEPRSPRGKATAMPVRRRAQPRSRELPFFRGHSCRKRDFRRVPHARVTRGRLLAVKASVPETCDIGPRMKPPEKSRLAPQLARNRPQPSNREMS